MVEVGAMPQIFYYECVASALDTAYELFQRGKLQIWESVLAKTQTAGRGQMRRHWDSPAGNIYAALRLPLLPPFNSTASAMAMAALLLRAFLAQEAEANCLLIKWPNDLVIQKNGMPAKIAGILLEERPNCLLAGLGINLRPAAIKMRADSALPAASLADTRMGSHWQPEALWAELVKEMFSFYNNGHFSSIWLNLVNKHLLWRNCVVEIADNLESYSGILRGIGANGCAILANLAGEKEICSGSMAARV